jgi:hypothetical protein
MEWSSAAVPILLAGTFLAAAAGKLARWRETVEWFGLLGFPNPISFSGLAVASEFVLVSLLIFAPEVGAAASLAWLVTATALLLRSRHLRIGCGCFGSRSNVTATTFARNAALLFLCGLGVVFPPLQPLPPVDAIALALGGPALLLAQEAVGMSRA